MARKSSNQSMGFFSGNTSIPTESLSIVQFIYLTDWSFLVRYVSPTIIVVSLLANILTILAVLGRKLYVKSPVFVFIFFVALADLGSVLSLNVIDFFDKFGLVPMTDLTCNIKSYFHFAMRKISVLGLIAAYIFKLWGLLRPLQLVSTDQTKTSFIICTSIVVFVLLVDTNVFMLNVFAALTDVAIQISDRLILVYECSIRPRFNIPYIMYYVVIYVFLSGILLIALSGAILASIHISYRRHKRLTAPENNQIGKPTTVYAQSSSFSSAKAAASMLIPIAVIHLMITLPRYILTMIYFFRNFQLTDFTLIIVQAYLTSRCLAAINYGLNFYVQMACSKFFRDAVLGRQ